MKATHIRSVIFEYFSDVFDTLQNQAAVHVPPN